MVLQHPLRLLGFALLSATPEVEAAGQAFYSALIWAAPATLVNFVMVGWFLGYPFKLGHLGSQESESRIQYLSWLLAPDF